MWLEILLSFLEYFLYVSVSGIVSAIVSYVLYRRGMFDRVGRNSRFLLVGIGTIFPFIDVIETWIGFEYEANPLIKSYGEYGWLVFIFVHLAASFIAFLSLFYVDWTGKSKNKICTRATLGWLDIFWMIVVITNAFSLKLYGII